MAGSRRAPPLRRAGYSAWDHALDAPLLGTPLLTWIINRLFGTLAHYGNAKSPAR
jgi:hypothetical protein